MISTITKEFILNNGVWELQGKKYPDWYGIQEIGFIWINTQSDPQLEYNGNIINSYLVEDYWWNEFVLDCREGGEEISTENFRKYMYENKKQVIEFINTMLESEE